jgi:hypothetical protein
VTEEFNSKFKDLVEKRLGQGSDSSWEQREKNGGGEACILDGGGPLGRSSLGIGWCTLSILVVLGRSIHCSRI